jgi:hypothetical protein
MPTPTPRCQAAMNAALAVDAQLDRLIDLITAHRTARLKEAREKFTSKTDGLLARLESEYAILEVVEEIFSVDLSDDCEAIANECRDECGFDLRENGYVYNPEAAADWACHLADVRRDERMLDQWGQA